MAYMRFQRWKTLVEFSDFSYQKGPKVEDHVKGGTARVIWASAEPFGELVSKVIKNRLHKHSFEFHTGSVDLKINFFLISAGGFFIFSLFEESKLVMLYSINLKFLRAIWTTFDFLACSYGDASEVPPVLSIFEQSILPPVA